MAMKKVVGPNHYFTNNHEIIAFTLPTWPHWVCLLAPLLCYDSLSDKVSRKFDASQAKICLISLLYVLIRSLIVYCRGILHGKEMLEKKAQEFH